MDDFYDLSCSHAYSKVKKNDSFNYPKNLDSCAFDDEFDRLYQEFLSLGKKLSDPNYDWSEF